MSPEREELVDLDWTQEDDDWIIDAQVVHERPLRFWQGLLIGLALSVVPWGGGGWIVGHLFGWW